MKFEIKGLKGIERGLAKGVNAAWALIPKHYRQWLDRQSTGMLNYLARDCANPVDISAHVKLTKWQVYQLIMAYFQAIEAYYEYLGARYKYPKWAMQQLTKVAWDRKQGF